MKLKLTFYCHQCGKSTSTTNEIVMEKRICAECRRGSIRHPINQEEEFTGEIDNE